MAEAWNDSYYSLTLNSSGYRFYGVDEPPGAQTAIFIESNLSIEAYKIQYAEAQATASAAVSISSIEIQYASSTVDGLLSNIVVALEEQRARTVISLESSLLSTAMKDAYIASNLDGDVSITASPIEIQYAQVTAQDAFSSLEITAIEVVYASVNAMSIESSCILESERVRVISISLSAETSVNVGSYKFARALIDNLVDGSLAGTAYKETWAYVSMEGDASVTPRAIEIQYAQIDAMSSESNVSATAIEILLASTSTSGESDLTATAYEIQLAVADWQVEGYVLTLAQEILYPEITISGTSDLNATAYKIAHSQSALSIESEVAVLTMKDAYARHESQIDSDVIATAIEILYAQAVLDGTAFNVIVGKEILLARITIGIESALLALMPTRFSDNIVEDTQIIRTLVLIDNKPITEQTRSLASYILQPNIQNSNWKNARNRYYKSSTGRRGFSLSWTMIPNSREQTVDLKFARDLINQIGSDPDTHTIKILNIDSSGTTPYTQDEYNVIVKNYSESLIRRDLVGGEYWWNCNLELEEV